MTSLYVGVDVAKDESVYSLPDGQSRAFDNTRQGFRRARGWIAGSLNRRPAHLVLESTGPYGIGLTKFFHRVKGWKVSVVNPKQVRRFAEAQLRRNKTDQVDAQVLAQFGEAMGPLPWEPLAPEREALQALVRRLGTIKRTVTAEHNRLHALEFAQLATGEAKASIHRSLAFLRQEQRRLEKAIRGLIASHAELKKEVNLLQTIPGVGWTTAACLLGEIGEPSRYLSPKALVAHAGLAPSQRTSGVSVRGKTTLCREGSRALRRLLYMPAVVALRHNPTIAAFYQRLLTAGKPKMVALLAAMHKLLRLCWGVLKNQRPFQHPLLTTQNP